MIAFELLDSAVGQLAPALANIRDYDWLIFTSQNGVRFFLQIIHEIYARYDALAFGPPPRIAAVGSKTADFLQSNGLRVDLVPDDFVGEALIDALGNLDDKRVLFPRARRGRREIVAAMRERGADVDEVVLYDTVSAEPDLSSLADGFDAILFSSPSAVQNLTARHAIFQKNGVFPLVACIGEITARAAEEAGLTVNIMPDQSTIDSLIDAVVKYYLLHNE